MGEPPDDTTKPGQLISFAKAKEDREGAPFTRKPWTYKPGACQHETGFDVDQKEHEVTCRRCGKVVDPFKALWIVAIEWDWTAAQDGIKRLKADADKLRSEVDALKALRSKLTSETTLPGKYVRKTLRGLVDTFKRQAAGCVSRKDKSGAAAYDEASFLVRTTLEHLVDGLVADGGDDG